MNKNLLLALFCFCTLGTTAQQSEWKTGKDGWVYRKTPVDNKFKKFFAIGLWNIPGYTDRAMEDDPESYRENAKRYLDRTSLYNLVYLSPGNTRDLHGRVEVTGSVGFYETLKEYQRNIPGLTNGNDRDYAVRQYLRKHVNDSDFIQTIDSLIDRTIETLGNVDHIWAPIDEIVNGGAGSGWCWHPEIGTMIRERIKKREKQTLVYTDLVGVARGNAFLFERNYLQHHPSMPDTPPYEALGDSAVILKERPLLGFVRAYDGKPVYDNGTANYTHYDLDTLKTLFFENLKICAQAYRSCGDVFGINAFIDCNTHPVLAGVTVDAIKAGRGRHTPVWLFFDGNGYAKPDPMPVETFIENLKCQIYTAIIHGATGILFWNDRSRSPEVFQKLESVIRELNEHQEIISAKTTICKSEAHLHYMIKSADRNRRFILAANSNTTESIKLDLPGIDKKELKPLEVYIAEIQPNRKETSGKNGL